MKKTFKLEELDCANCAAKMENAIRKLEGVTDAQVNFFAQKLTLEAADDVFDDVLARAAAVCKKIEPDCRIIL
ncbi:MAG: cation transporter [Clostridia bacterium]|nr:cation transporter [Clostridia bacterium]